MDKAIIRYAMIYSNIKKKHPNWKPGQIKYCTVYALRHKKKR